MLFWCRPTEFEVFECQAAIADIRSSLLDDPPDHPGGLDVLAQHCVGMAIADPFHADDLYAEVREAFPYRNLEREDFDQVLEFLTTGGYALKAYEKFHKLVPGKDGLYRMASRQVALQQRLNAGTIVESQTLTLKLRGGGTRAKKSRNISSSRWFPGTVSSLPDGFSNIAA